jgi:hypothetical protein
MDLLNILKIIAATVTVIIAITVGIIELRLNPENLLNRWFFLFFISTALGFSAYTAYHFILFNADLVIPIMITAHILINFIPISLVMTVFIIEKYKKIAMSFRYLGVMMILFVIMSFGYFILRPELNLDDYSNKIVNTETRFELFIFVNLIRILLFLFVVYKYAKITRSIGEDTKKRIQWFFAGIIMATIGLFFNVAGGLLDWIPMEIIALIAVDIGIVLVFKGFLMQI